MRSNNIDAAEASGLISRRAKLWLVLALPIVLALAGCPVGNTPPGPKKDDVKKDDVAKGGDGDPKKATPGKVYKSPAELFADMPKDAHPGGGEEDTPERKLATAKKQCKFG